MHHVRTIPHKNIFLMLFTLAAAIIIIVGRLVYLQIHLNEALHTQSKKNFLRIEIIKPTRGNIVDIRGNLLATNRPVHNLYWRGNGRSLLSPEYVHILEKIEDITQQAILDDTTRMRELHHAERHQKQVLLATDLSFDKLCQIEELFPDDNTLRIETEFQRLYPHGTSASHLLGYLGNIKTEPKGRMGLEQWYEEQLAGKQGIKQKTINSVGRSLMVQTLEEAMAGTTIHTTLDLLLQQLVETVFPPEYTGTCIVMRPSDGSILALLSRPNFDPNTFLTPILISDWHSMQEGQLFLNRAFSACYPPGSLFKLVTACAAWEEGIITPETCWFCHGYFVLANRKYQCQCHKTWGRAELTAKQALARSCNTFFYEIGRKMSIDTLADYAHRFGLGSKTSKNFPEKAGLIPTSRWKLQTKGERWYPGENIQAMIGQSFLLVTPIQMARMVASIFTGYLVTPRILVDEPIVQMPLTINEQTLEFLQDSMRSVATQGTGQRMSRLKDIEIYAKTSTAQTSGLEKRDLGTSYLEHAWFVAYFKYKHHEPLVVVFLIENAGTSRVATILAKKFLVEYKKFMDTHYGEFDST